MTRDLSTRGTPEPRTTVVIPTVGRPSLVALLDALAGGTRPVDCAVLVVDDRPRPADDLAARLEYLRPWLPGLRVLRSGGGGPARARNLGWRHARTEWVSFLDDDVLPDADWYDALLRDLGVACPGVAGSQGAVRVPMPHGRRPTDWERTTSGLATATWITADLSYRRAALAAVGGFDERFPRAYREDADLGLRVTGTQGDIVHGVRRVTHPVRPADDWVSVRQQAGNADDFLMSRLHGPDWRERCQAPTGRRRQHVATVGAGLVAAAAALTGRRRTAWVGALAWSASSARFA
ncbi:MAG: glycosyltransferase family 2 protein, partial [Ornithinibacter sp.]